MNAKCLHTSNLDFPEVTVLFKTGNTNISFLPVDFVKVFEGCWHLKILISYCVC